MVWIFVCVFFEFFVLGYKLGFVRRLGNEIMRGLESVI